MAMYTCTGNALGMHSLGCRRAFVLSMPLERDLIADIMNWTLHFIAFWGNFYPGSVIRLVDMHTFCVSYGIAY